jgi:hypothetical protein
MRASDSTAATRRKEADGEVWTIHFPSESGARPIADALCWLLIRRCTNAEVPAEGDRIAISPGGALRFPPDQHASGVPEWVESLFFANVGRLMPRLAGFITYGPTRPLTERELPSCDVVLRSRPK